MRRRTMIICLSVLAVAGLGGGAYAATRSSPAPIAVPTQVAGAEHSYINDVARRLHVTSARLTAALKGAAIDQIDAAAKGGHLTAAQANAFKEQIAHASGLPFGPLAFGPPVLPRATAFGQVMKAPGFFGPPAVLPAAAKYLGLALPQLMQELRSGKTLAQIAQAKGKSTGGLEQAIISDFKAFLQKPAAAGHMPQPMQQKLLAALRKWAQSIVTMRGAAGRPFALSLPLALRPANAHIQIVAPRGARVQVPIRPGNVRLQLAAPPFLSWLMGDGPPFLPRLWLGPPPGGR